MIVDLKNNIKHSVEELSEVNDQFDKKIKLEWHTFKIHNKTSQRQKSTKIEVKILSKKTF